MVKKDIGKKTEKQGDRKQSVQKEIKTRLPRTKPVFEGRIRAFFSRLRARLQGINRRALLIGAGALALVILLAAVVPPVVRGMARQKEKEPYTVVHATPRPTPTPEPKEPPVIDLSAVAVTVPLESAMNRINEPTPWEEELVYSAGQSSGIDEMIFTKLYTYNMNTKEETEEAESQIKNKVGLPGELYECRMNDRWIVWLDTNQAGTNVIRGKDRLTGEIFTIRECALIRPQLRLYGDNLVYLVQESADQDCLYLYDMQSRESVMLEAYEDSTYGTCPPAIYGDILVWAVPNPDYPDISLLKWLDLSEGLAGIQTGQGTSTPPAATLAPSSQGEGDTVDSSPSPDESNNPVSEGDDPYMNGDTGDGEGAVSEEDDPYLEGGGMLKPDREYGEVIDPGSFAIYPETNGDVIVYLDGLDPANARLMMIRKDGEPVAVAQGVGRLYGVGEDFIVYTQSDQIMLYFWELDRYARLTPEGQKGLLPKACVNGNTIVWYDANDPNSKGDTVYISTVQTPSGTLLEY